MAYSPPPLNGLSTEWDSIHSAVPVNHYSPLAVLNMSTPSEFVEWVASPPRAGGRRLSVVESVQAEETPEHVSVHIDALQAKVEAQEAEIERLKAQLGGARSSPTAAAPPAESGGTGSGSGMQSWARRPSASGHRTLQSWRAAAAPVARRGSAPSVMLGLKSVVGAFSSLVGFKSRRLSSLVMLGFTSKRRQRYKVAATCDSCSDEHPAWRQAGSQTKERCS